MKYICHKIKISALLHTCDSVCKQLSGTNFGVKFMKSKV